MYIGGKSAPYKENPVIPTSRGIMNLFMEPQVYGNRQLNSLATSLKARSSGVNLLGSNTSYSSWLSEKATLQTDNDWSGTSQVC